MAATTMKILAEIDPIVKLVCHDIHCRFNTHNVRAHNTESEFCSSKYLEIGTDGTCLYRQHAE